MPSRKDSVVFSPGRIGSVEMKNRLIRSATYENAATREGRVTDALLSMYRDLALGGAGLVVTGATAVYARTHYPHLQMSIYDDSCIEGLTRLTRTVHEAAPDCRIMAQLHHPGRQVTNPEDAEKLVPVRAPMLLAFQRLHPDLARPSQKGPVHRVEPTAPSAVRDRLFDRVPREMTPEEIEAVITGFVDGVRRSREAGFDGIQLHAAHGWLLSSFLSPHTNLREDAFGGSTEGRCRIVTEIVRRARALVGEDFPILIKMNTTDFFPDGTDLAEAVRVAALLEESGFNAIEPSGGMWECVVRGEEALGWPAVMLPESRTKIRKKEQEAYFIEGARAVKKAVNIPIMTVGGIRSFDRAEEIITAGDADFVSLARPLIRQPDLPNLWMTGKGKNRADCISCNACLVVGAQPTACRAKKS
ncbi:MAG: NADH:flavin oxidoreductase [Deltaproteobacteria bacterium]|nr:NADH:flavin oxidoreductase [Deltaproteobacteria bacterium]